MVAAALGAGEAASTMVAAAFRAAAGEGLGVEAAVAGAAEEGLGAEVAMVAVAVAVAAGTDKSVTLPARLLAARNTSTQQIGLL